MRTLLLVTIGVLAALSPAQSNLAPDQTNVLAAGKRRLEAALSKTASLQDTAFAAEWGAAKKKGEEVMAGGNPFAIMVASRSSGKATGSWHPHMSLCSFDGDTEDEFVTVGRRTIARSGDHDWSVRAGRFADGNSVSFTPDIELLLQLLDDWNLAVIHREVGSIDDRPVEIITVTLNADQVTEAVWAGALPPSLVSGLGGNVFRILAGARGGDRQAAPAPKATVDIAIAIDPATSLVHRLSSRAYAEAPAGGGMGQVVIARGGAGNIAVRAAGDEEEDEEGEVDESGPMQFEDGLPVRSRKKKSVSNFTVNLSEHGQRTAPGLTPAQKKLLRVR